MRLKKKKDERYHQSLLSFSTVQNRNGGGTLSLPQCTPRLEEGGWKKAKMQRAMRRKNLESGRRDNSWPLYIYNRKREECV